MDLTLFLLHQKIFPRLRHDLVFGAETVRAAGEGRAACPRCGAAGFELRAGSAGWCPACGRVGWWSELARGRGGDAAFAEAARRAGLPARVRGGLDLAAIESAEGFADLLEALMARSVAAARGGKRVRELCAVYGVKGIEVEVGVSLPAEEIAEVVGRFPEELVDRGLHELKAAGLLDEPRALMLVHRDRMGMPVGLVSAVVEKKAVRVRRGGGAGAFHGGVMDGETVVACGDAVEALLLTRLGVGAVAVEAERRAVGELHAAGARVMVVLESPDRAAALEIARAAPADLVVAVVELGGERAAAVCARDGAAAFLARVRGAVALPEVELAEATRGLDVGKELDRGAYFDALRGLEKRMERVRAWPRVVAAAARALGIGGVELARELRLREEEARRRDGLVRWRGLVEEAGQRLVEGDADGVAAVFRRAAEEPGVLGAAPVSLDVGRTLSSLEQAPREMLTGYPDLDDAVRVLPTELVLVAARPSHGKTTFGLNVLLNVLKLARLAQEKRPSILFSYEVQQEFLVGKLMSALTGRYSFHDVLTYLRSGDRDDPIMEEARERLAGYGGLVHAVTQPSLTVEDLVGYCRRVAESAGGLGVVIVDYLQIVPIAEPTISKDLQVTRAVKALRTAAQELQVPIVCLAQVNPPFARDEEPRPLLAHLVESTSIEQEANTILMLYNETVHRAQWELSAKPTEGEVVPLEVIIRKHKYGAINRTVLLDYRMRTNEIRPRGGFSRVIEV